MTPATRSLLRASAIGDVNLVKALLAQGTDVNCVTAAGQTPLMLAAGFGHEAAVVLLLNAGALLESQDELGLTAIDWAANSSSISSLITGAEKARSTKTVETPPHDLQSTPIVPASVEETAEPVSEVRADLLPPPIGTSEIGVETAAPKVTLGGLAGAILRERAAKTIRHTQRPADDISAFLPPPAPPLMAVETPFETTIDLDAGVSNAKPETVSSIDTEGRAATETTAQSDPNDETLSRGTIEVSYDTSPATAPVVTGQHAPAVSRSQELSTERNSRWSKVEIEVPSGTPIRPTTSRTVLWVLIIAFLGGGAFAGYRLSSYLVNNRTNNHVATATPAANVQPKTMPVKSAPIVGGDLAGTELFVPDAGYPVDSGESKSGSVVVQVQVNQRGIVISAKATEGLESLRAAAEKAGKHAAFSPDKLRGKGRTVSGTITYSFVPPETTAAAASSPATHSSSPAGSTVTPSVGGPLAGAELKLPLPDYPLAAKSAGIGGTMTIVVRVNRAGRVVSWRTLDGDNRLRAAALKAAKQSTFSPEKLPGSGDVVGTITYNFIMH